MIKPVVTYNLDKHHEIELNRGAYIYPIDHPSDRVSNLDVARTSTVISVNGDDFETLNTKYVGVHNGELMLDMPKFLRRHDD